ncbi:MAG: DHH family phosphoesterase [Lachnospiraceae bacterium]|nr:DHH family phosphoesterase [Lachnospiraceae bacterium]
MDILGFYTLIEYCRNKRTFIQTHNIPDPDAIGSAFGLQKIFRSFGLRATICYDGELDRISAEKMLDMFGIEMFSNSELRDSITRDDCIICIDTQNNAGNITDLNGNEIAVIDHHPEVEYTHTYDYLYKDIRKVGACCSLIAQYFKELEIEPSSDTATALLHGIKMDTLQFTRGVTKTDIEMFSYLIDYIDDDKLKGLEISGIVFNDLKTYSAAINNIHVFDYLGISYIPFPCPDSLVSMVADFIMSLKEIQVAVVYNVRPDGLKFSVRSEKREVDAGVLVSAALAGLGNGGGHAAMAGGRIKSQRLSELGPFREHFINDRFMKMLGIQNKRSIRQSLLPSGNINIDIKNLE